MVEWEPPAWLWKVEGIAKKKKIEEDEKNVEGHANVVGGAPPYPPLRVGLACPPAHSQAHEHPPLRVEGHARTCSSLGPRSREARFLLSNDGTKIKHRM